MDNIKNGVFDPREKRLLRFIFIIYVFPRVKHSFHTHTAYTSFILILTLTPILNTKVASCRDCCVNNYYFFTLLLSLDNYNK